MLKKLIFLKNFVILQCFNAEITQSCEIGGSLLINILLFYSSEIYKWTGLGGWGQKRGRLFNKYFSNLHL